jgi:LytS/YehU family sensor histidine kinase
MLFAALLCLAADAAFRRWRIGSHYARIAMIIGFSAFGSFAWNICNLIVQTYMRGHSIEGSSFFMAIAPNLQWAFWVFLSWSGIWFALDSRDRMAKQELELANSRLAASEAQNQMLRYQLNPHFMFNALSAIATMATHEKPRHAENAILSLSRFLRASYQYAPSQKIPLCEELNLAEDYMDVEMARFEDRLILVQEISEGAHEALVPNLILQPLLENAIKHGVSGTLEPVIVTIAAEVRGRNLALSVRDDAAPGPRAARQGCSGVGLRNIGQRIENMYPGRGVFSAGPTDHRGFMASIELPLEHGA